MIRCLSIPVRGHARRAPVVLLLAAAVLVVCVPEARARDQHLKFQHLTIEDGLSQGSVECILQDARGFMWFGTSDGLNRYDGRRIKVFKHDRNDRASISNNFVRHMIEARDGSFWIATKGGLNRFDPATETFEWFRHDPADSSSLSSDNVMRVHEDSRGVLWVGTWGGGLCSYDRESGSWRRYGAELRDHEFARGNIVNVIHESPDGTLWVGAITGLFSLDPARDQVTLHDMSGPGYDGARDNIVIHIYERGGALWLGTYTGLVRYDAGAGSIDRYPLDPGDPKNIAANQVRFVNAAPGDSAQLWLCTATRGLAVFDSRTGAMEFHTHDAGDPISIAHDALWSSYRDRGGTMWVGTAGQGVDRLTPMATRFPHTTGLPGSNSVWSLCEDDRGNLWVGTNAGLVARDAGTGRWRHIEHESGNPYSIGDGSVYSILQDRDGALWFATASTGLSRLDPGAEVDGPLRFRHYRHQPGNADAISADRLFSLLEDRDGRLWVGTVDEGADVLDRARERFDHYRPDRGDPDSINDNGVECIFQDAAGTFWFGTLAGGLNRLDSGSDRFRHYLHDPDSPAGISNNHVTSIVEDGDGNLWVATADGLNRLAPDRMTFTHYFESDGLPNNYIYALVLDGAGLLWMSTNSGLARLDPASGTARVFTTRDGLQSNEFNAGAYHRSPRGRVYFGGHNGFNHFMPGTIRDNLSVPPVVLTSFYVLGEPAALERAVYATDNVTLSHRDYYFSFEFAALDYWAPDRNRYQYRMEGLDRDWIDGGTRNFVNYTHLDAGEYEFRVRASNGDGVWNEEGASIGITITPPFWKRTWFLGLVALIGATTAFGFHRFRLNRLLEIERLRTRISSDLHDEIATNLSSIAMFSGMIEADGATRDEERSRRLLVRLRELAEESVVSIRDIIWAIGASPETLDDLLTRLRDTMLPTFRARGIDLVFDQPAPESLPQRNLAPEQRQHLWLLLKEILNNTVKHSECSRVAVTIRFENGRLAGSVRDDGRGFDPGHRYEGNGLRTMRMRTAQLRGDLAVESAPGKGTTVRFDIPL